MGIYPFGLPKRQRQKPKMFKKHAPDLKIRSNPVLKETPDPQPAKAEDGGATPEGPTEPVDTESPADQPGAVVADQPRSAVTDRLRSNVKDQSRPPSGQPKITIAGTDAPVEYAGFARRAFALVLDQIFIIATEWFFLSPAFLAILYSENIGWALTIVIAISVAVMHYWIYTAFFEHSKWQATPGKFLVGLKVTDLKGNQLSFWRSTFRLLVQYVVSFALTVGILLVIYVLTSKFHPLDKVDISPQTPLAYIAATISGYCFVLFTQKRQTLFDKAAGRLVSFQPGYANSKQLTPWECFKASFGKLPAQAKLFLSIANPASKRARVKLILAASLCLAACAWSFFAIFQIAQSIVIVESSINAATADKEQPKTPIKKMELVYDALETVAHRLNLKGLEKEIQDRALLYSKNITKVLNRANAHIDAHEFAMAERAINTAIRTNEQFDVSSSDSKILSTRAYLALEKGDINSARTLALDSLKKDPYERVAIEILQVDGKRFSNYRRLKDISPVYQHPHRVSRYQIESYFETSFYEPDEDYLNRKLKECDQVLAIMPDCTQALVTKAQIAVAQHKPKDALAIFEKAIASAPDSAKTITAYADFLSDSDNASPESAVEMLRKLPAASQNAKVHAKIADILDMNAISSDDDKEILRLRQEAIAEYDKAIKLAPNRIEYYTEKGKLLGYIDKNREAVDVFKQALTLDFEKDAKNSVLNSETDVRLKLATAYSDIHEIENAEREFSLLVAKDPRNADIYESRGRMMLDNKRYQEAIPLFTQALSIKRGISKTVTDKISDTILDVFLNREKKYQNQITEINNSQISSLLNYRAQAHEGSGDINKALADYTESLLMPNDYNSEPKKIAQLHIRLGSPEEAVKTYAVAIARVPDNWRLHLIQAALLDKIGRKEEAEKERQNAVKVAEREVAKEQSDINYFVLAQTCLANKNYAQAHDAINVAIKKDADDSSYRILLAKILMAQNQKTEALAIVRKEKPGDCDCNLEDVARILQGCGQYKESLKPVNKMLKADAKDANALYLRSRIFANEGLSDKAAQELKTAQSLGYGKDPTLDLPF